MEGGGELPNMEIPLPLRALVRSRQPGKKRESRDAREFVPKSCDEARGCLGDLDKRAMIGVLLVSEPGLGRSSANRVLIGEGVPGGPEKGLAR